MDRFIWIGNNCVNLDCIVKFLMDDKENAVYVLLRGTPPDERTLVANGEDGKRLISILRTVKLGGPDALQEIEIVCPASESIARVVADEGAVALDVLPGSESQ